MKRFGKFMSNVKQGSIVCVKVDIRNRSHANPRGILGIVFNVPAGPAFDIRVATSNMGLYR
jgi:hypothetical protein